MHPENATPEDGRAEDVRGESEGAEPSEALRARSRARNGLLLAALVALVVLIYFITIARQGGLTRGP